jgi:formylglycine-generating enzyme required for sulfatase activity
MPTQSSRPVKFKRVLILCSIVVLGLALTFLVDRLGGRHSRTHAEAGAPGPDGRGWTNSIGMTFVPIPAGTFIMGSESGEADSHERPPHSVTLSRSFYMATTEVTQAQWDAVMESNPSKFRGDDLPVEQVSWNDAQGFVRKLNTREGTTTYRLPTEAEWEYACRAGTTGGWYGDLGSVAWYEPNSGGTTHPAGQKQANAWGLYDVLGNVYEWCEDWKGAYPSGSVTDPRGPSGGSARVVRGGSWLIHANRARSYFRDFLTPDERREDVGFRIVAVARTS